MREKQLREPEEKKELAQTLKAFYVEATKKGFVQCISKTIIRFGFCDIQNNQGLGKGYQPQPNPYLDLDYSGYHKNLIQ